MISVRQILSEAQNHFEDLSMDRIQKAEYLDIFNDIAMDIAEKTNAWIIRYGVTPKANTDDEDTNIASIPYTDTTENIDLSSYKVMQVIRGIDGSFTYCNEYGYPHLRNTITGDVSFRVNTTHLTALEFFIHNNPNTKTMDLYFGRNFELGEQAVITLVTSRPFGNPVFGNDPKIITKWEANDNPINSIPDYMRNAFRWGLIYRITERLYNRGDDNYTWRRMNAEKAYQKALIDVAAYTYKFKDRYSKIKLQPINWFAE